MLKELQKTQPQKPSQRYVSIADLAHMTGEKHGVLYHFIMQYNRTHEHPLPLARLPMRGKRLYLKEEDAEMICALFAHPEDYAEPVKPKPAR